MRRIVESILGIASVTMLFLGCMFLVWFQTDGMITNARDESTNNKLVVKFTFKSNSKHYSGEMHESAPVGGNTTIDDLYALYPIGKNITMRVNPMFKHNSTMNSYPWIMLLATISAFAFTGVFIASMVMIRREPSKKVQVYYNIREEW